MWFRQSRLQVHNGCNAWLNYSRLLARAPISLRSEQQSSLKKAQSRRHSEGIVTLFRAVATKSESFSGAPIRAKSEWPHAALNFLALEPLKFRKSVLPAAILFFAAVAFLNSSVL